MLAYGRRRVYYNMRCIPRRMIASGNLARHIPYKKATTKVGTSISLRKNSAWLIAAIVCERLMHARWHAFSNITKRQSRAWASPSARRNNTHPARPWVHTEAAKAYKAPWDPGTRRGSCDQPGGRKRTYQARRNRPDTQNDSAGETVG